MVSYTYTSGSFGNLFNDPFFIGFDKLADRLTGVTTQQSGFPPYNVRKLDEDNFVIDLAVAGYSKDTLSIEEQDGTLTIKGEKPDDTDTYLHKGIAGRKFTRTFALGEYMHVDNADFNDGMLYIIIKREIPEEKKPKSIKIR